MLRVLKRSYLIKQFNGWSCCNFTVYALSSGHGKCGVSVIRISGEQARQSILKMTKSLSKDLPHPRQAVLRHIIDPDTGEPLDKGLVLWFPGPKSFTGEDCVEFHIHGSTAVTKAVLSSLGKLKDYTPANPGDFTKRAFYNGKLDLTSVEGLGDLIHAETEAQRKQAFRQMEGFLCEKYSTWRKLILRSRANIEAYIDFSEDDNIEQGVLLDVRRNLERLVEEISVHLVDSRKGERLKSGLKLAILGKPNVGKSSFLNMLVQRPAAIVSPVAGTTRDIVQVSVDLGGYPLSISDTAGLRFTEDPIEKEGVRRAIREVEQADIVLIIVDARDFINSLDIHGFSLKIFLDKYLQDVGIWKEDLLNNEWFCSQSYLLLVNKIDLLHNDESTLLKRLEENKVCLTSLKTSEGLDSTLNKLKVLCEQLCGLQTGESAYVTSQRQRTHIEGCLKHLIAVIGPSSVVNVEEDESPQKIDFAQDLLSREDTLILAAQRLQLASNQLGHVTGHITTEDVLDHIFSSFCIGK